MATAFNIYKRNPNGLNKKAKLHIYKDLHIVELRQRKGTKFKELTNKDYCYSIVGWGCSLGKVSEFEGKYATEYYFYCTDDILKAKVIHILYNTNWKELTNSISAKSIRIWELYRYLKNNIPELELKEQETNLIDIFNNN